MVYTRREYMKELEESIAFDKEYLAICIAANRDDETIEYAEKLARHLKEYTAMRDIEERYGHR